MGLWPFKSLPCLFKHLDQHSNMGANGVSLGARLFDWPVVYGVGKTCLKTNIIFAISFGDTNGAEISRSQKLLCHAFFL